MEQIIEKVNIHDCNGDVYTLIGKPGESPTFRINNRILQYKLDSEENWNNLQNIIPTFQIQNGNLVCQYEGSDQMSLGRVIGNNNFTLFDPKTLIANFHTSVQSKYGSITNRIINYYQKEYQITLTSSSFHIGDSLTVYLQDGTIILVKTNEDFEIKTVIRNQDITHSGSLQTQSDDE